MVEKICSHCGATVLVGLQYCPSCLHSVRSEDTGPGPAATVAPAARETRLERLQSKWEAVGTWFNSSASSQPLAKDDPRFAYGKPNMSPTTTMSEGYTRVVCPKCHRPHRAPLNQLPSSRLMCTACFHQFPASMAAEFRKGADLNCFHCGVTTFCVNGLRVNHCPNCKVSVTRPRDPEKARLLAMAAFVLTLVVVGFGHAVATQTISQFLVWLCVGSVFTFFGFVALVALGL